ncbi:hypothetical protein U9M48_012693, partial [Paspalum notatum var. saurae]
PYMVFSFIRWTTFLNGELDEEIYMDQPAGFVENGQEGMVCKLEFFTSTTAIFSLIRIAFTTPTDDFVKPLYGLKQEPKQCHEKGQGVILCLYVDDILIFGTNLGMINVLLMKNRRIARDQLRYFQIIGSLMYLASSTRPDISFAVSKLSRFVSNPGDDHWRALERV